MADGLAAMPTNGGDGGSAAAHVHVTLLAPAYNEEAVLEQFGTVALTQLHDDWELLVVDDGSVDRTREIAEHFAQADQRVRGVAHPENRGPGAALATGFAHARGDIVVTLDSDLSRPVDQLPPMLGGLRDPGVGYGGRSRP